MKPEFNPVLDAMMKNLGLDETMPTLDAMIKSFSGTGGTVDDFADALYVFSEALGKDNMEVRDLMDLNTGKSISETIEKDPWNEYLKEKP